MSGTVKLAALGDVAVVGGFRSRFTNDLAQAVDARLVEIVKKCDIGLGNVECVLTDSKSFEVPGYGLWTPPAVAGALREIGITIASLANNHIRDLGDRGVADTIRYLKSAGITTCGAGPDASAAAEPLVFTKNNIRFGILAVAEKENNLAGDTRAGAAEFAPEHWATGITALRDRVDIVIVSVHAGHEFAAVPSPRIRNAYHAALEAGAHCVIGHHPHVVQGIETCGETLILHSLGNFCFDSDYVASYPGWDIGIVAEIEFDRRGVRSHAIHPIRIERGQRVELLVGEDRHAALKKVEDLSEILRDEATWLEEWARHVEWRFNQDYLQNFRHLDDDFRGENGSRLARVLHNYFACPTHRELIADYLSARIHS